MKNSPSPNITSALYRIDDTIISTESAPNQTNSFHKTHNIILLLLLYTRNIYNRLKIKGILHYIIRYMYIL